MKNLFATIIFNIITAVTMAATFSSTHLSVSDILSSSQVRMVTQDNLGFIWMGTNNGLYRYDGYIVRPVQPLMAQAATQRPEFLIQDICTWGDRLLLLRLRGERFTFFDLQRNIYVDYTTPDEINDSYKRSVIINDKELWLYDDRNGCKYVVWNGTGFTTVKLTQKNGLLGNSHVNFVARDDSNGYWIGTTAGVTHWNGGLKGIYNRKLNIVACANAGQQGLYLFSARGDVFVVKHGKLQNVRATGNGDMPTIKKAARHKETIYLTTTGATYEYDIRKQQFSRSTTIPITAANMVEDNHKNPVIFDSEGQDVFYFTPQQIYTLHNIYSAALNKLNNSGRFRFVSGSNSMLWVSTYGNGLFCYDTRTGEQTHITCDVASMKPIISSNYLLGIYEGHDNKIWTIEENTGLSIISPDDNVSQYYYYTSATDNSHANNIRLLRLIGQKLYVANFSHGLKTASADLKSWQDAESHDDDVVDIGMDKDGTLWTGSRNNGIYVGGVNYRHDKNNPHSLSEGKISSIVFDHKGRAWISLFNSGVDMAVKQKDGTLRFKHFFTGKNKVSTPRKLLADHNGYIWMCSSSGVYRFHPDELSANANRYQSFSLTEKGNAVECYTIIEDSQHRIWIGTNSHGIYIFNNNGREPLQERILTEDDGLTNNVIESFVEDRHHNIWAGTMYGLCRINGKDFYTETFYPGQTDLQNSFSEGCAALLPDGRIVFGSHQGMVVMSMSNRRSSSSPYNLVISDIDINGTPHDTFGEDDPIEGSITNKREIKLSHKQNSLTLYVTDFETNGRYRSRYSYYLEGADDDWSPHSEDNKVTYKNLKPGTYVFHVRSYSNNRASGTKEATMKIVIAPPLWATWWAYLIYIALAIAIGYYLYKNLRHIESLRNKISVEKQMATVKDRFFANVSHEFRTPLTLIQGSLDNIENRHQVPTDMKEPMESLNKSVNRLRRLIDQLLEFHQMENGSLRLALKSTDIITFCRDIFYTFSIQAQNKDINYQFVPFASHETAYIDINFLDHILFNLLSNAFKYTPQKEAITLRITHKENAYVISVEDTGVGVDKEKREQLFKRFNQSSRISDSMGIGLDLSAELARVHHGSISYEPNGDRGSIFSFTLPDNKEAYKSDEFLVEEDNVLLKDNDKQSAMMINEHKAMAFEPMNDCPVWIAEDIDDIKDMLKKELQQYFPTTAFANGQELWDALIVAKSEERPQLIITDAMMPVMDGFHLIKKIRADKNTSATPIVMLTALADDQQAVKGYNAGADAYITKPFSVPVLIAQCTMLLRQRTHLKADYVQTEGEKPELKAIITEEDDRKLKNLIDTFISDHIDDEKLNIDAFASSMGYGRTNFFRKVKELTGMTPNEYIRQARMELSAELLRDRTLTISQVAYKVGISDAYYFSKTFKNYFGITPSQYRKGDSGKARQE